MVGLENQQEVAKEFRISQQAVSRLVCKARKNQRFVNELTTLRDEQE